MIFMLDAKRKENAMDIAMLTKFFMWCTILNIGLLLLSFLLVAFGFGSDFVYRMHSKWFPMPRDTFNTVLYLLIGVYKIFVFYVQSCPMVSTRHHQMNESIQHIGCSEYRFAFTMNVKKPTYGKGEGQS